jgi:sugar phosphate permease
VPPTIAIANRAFGLKKAPILFGWISASHQVGAAAAAFLAGFTRTVTGSYFDAFVTAGAVAVLAALLSLMIGSGPQRRYANI